MKLPLVDFIEQINHKKVYYFSSSQILNSQEPHYFVCVGFDDDNFVILNCFTTKIERKKEYIETRGLDTSTLVFAKPSKENGLTQECVVNCNDLYFHSKEEFKALYKANKITCKGELEEVYYEQIFLGIQNSDLIEEELKLKIKGIDD